MLIICRCSGSNEDGIIKDVNFLIENARHEIFSPGLIREILRDIFIYNYLVT